jgi:hypothetical protein
MAQTTMIGIQDDEPAELTTVARKARPIQPDE